MHVKKVIKLCVKWKNNHSKALPSRGKTIVTYQGGKFSKMSNKTDQTKYHIKYTTRSCIMVSAQT